MGVTPSGAATANNIGYESAAWGTSVFASTTELNAGSQKSARTQIGCTTKPGLDETDSTASVTLPSPAGKVTAISDQSTTAKSGNMATAGASSSTGAVNLLGGLISAQSLTSSASASEDEDGSHPSTTASTTFVGLSIAGHSEPANVPANTTLTLPGIGSIVLNQQQSTSKARKGYPTYVYDNALVVTVSTPANPLGLAVGTTITVAHAEAGLTAPLEGKLGRVSYGTNIGFGPLKSGPTFQDFMGCFGTGGKVTENHGLAVSVGPLSSGSIVDQAMGIDRLGQPLEAQLSSSVSDINLAGTSPLPASILSASLVKAEATSITGPNGTTTLSEAGSEIGDLTVDGHEVSGPLPPPNTSIPIPGVGTLYVNEVITSGPTIQVRMLDLHISNSQLTKSLGTAEVEVAVADAKS